MNLAVFAVLENAIDATFRVAYGQELLVSLLERDLESSSNHRLLRATREPSLPSTSNSQALRQLPISHGLRSPNRPLSALHLSRAQERRLLDHLFLFGQGQCRG